jgi:hypothetical protein
MAEVVGKGGGGHQTCQVVGLELGLTLVESVDRLVGMLLRYVLFALNADDLPTLIYSLHADIVP